MAVEQSLSPESQKSPTSRRRGRVSGRNVFNRFDSQEQFNTYQQGGSPIPSEGAPDGRNRFDFQDPAYVHPSSPSPLPQTL